MGSVLSIQNPGAAAQDLLPHGGHSLRQCHGEHLRVFTNPSCLILLHHIGVLTGVFHVGMSALALQCKLIVCQMSNTRCQALSWLLLPMTLVVLLAVTGVVANETLLLHLWTAVVILAHIHYGVSVVRAHTHTHALS